MNTPVLAFEQVHHAFGPTEVLRGIDLRLQAGEVVVLLGPSGCGKTTLLHLAAGLHALQRGRVHGSACDGAPGAALRRAVMFQQPRLLPWLSTLDNVDIGLRARGVGRAEARRRAAAMGAAMGLDAQALAAFPPQLSGGMQSRAALARALVLAPALLLMDEPFAALDIGLRRQLQRLLLAHRRAHGTTVLMITHDVGEAARLADRVLVMAAAPGRLVHEHRIGVPAQARDETTVLHEAGRLLAVPAVQRSFGLQGDEGDGGGEGADAVAQAG